VPAFADSTSHIAISGSLGFITPAKARAFAHLRDFILEIRRRDFIFAR
jgi:hypothetical protein